MERVTVVKTFSDSFSSRPPNFHVSKPSLRDRDVGDQGAEDSEISIFDAKKYFNEINEQRVVISNRVSPVQINLDRISHQCDPSGAAGVARLSSASSSVDGFGRNYRSRSFRATPTASSEASWNSQTGLLTNPPGAISVSMRNTGGSGRQEKRGSAAARWLFRRKCPCSGKKSVQVEDKLSSEPKTPRLQLSLNHSSKVLLGQNSQLPRSKSVPEKAKSEQISAETVNPVATNSNFQQQEQKKFSPEKQFHSARGFTFPILNKPGPAPTTSGAEDPPRDSMESLDVFLPANPRLAAERDSKSFTFPISPRSRVMAAEDDMASDASSDLFEIESFSTQTTTTFPVIATRRDSLDEAARRLGGGGALYCCRRSVDEPMTPSVAGSECYAPSEASIEWSVTTATNYSVAATEWEAERDGGKKRGNGLLSCRCEKAVSVGPKPRAKAVEKWTVGTRKHVGNGNKAAMERSQSARLSLALATYTSGPHAVVSDAA